GFDSWLAVERTRRRDGLLARVVEAGTAALGVRPAPEVQRLADALERADPLNEPVVRLGLTADQKAGDGVGLHRRFRRFSSRLREELQAEPSPETRGLYEQLVQGKAADAVTEPAAQEPPRRIGRRPGLRLRVAA